MNARLEDLRRQAEALSVQLTETRDAIKREEEGRYVQVNFIGYPKFYTYEMAPGHNAEIGDYVCVYSPMMHQDELVKVRAKGKGSTLYRTPKIARQVEVRVRGEGIGKPCMSSEHPDDWDVFRGADIG